MRQLGIRGFGLGVVVMVALAIGAFVVLDHDDETAQAAPEASQSGAVPQGVVDLQFQCVAFGITELLTTGAVQDYLCHSDADTDVECVTDETQTLLSCLGGTDCVITGSEAECTDNDGGSHACSILASGVNCEGTSGGAVDYIDCFNDSAVGPLTCGTEAGPLLCMATPEEDFLEFVCAVVSSFPTALWADLDCDNEITSRDNQALLRRVLGNNPLSQTEPCPNLGDPVSYLPEEIDETALGTGQPGAVPQGVFDLQFRCMAFGITELMNAGGVGTYTCHAGGTTVVCLSDDPGVVECVSDELDSTCTITPDTGGTEAECTDSDGGSHACSIEGIVLNCEGTGGPAIDYIDCYNDGPVGPTTCGTESGPLVCLVTPDEFLTFLCEVVSSFPTLLWADMDCDNEITSRDNQALLRRVLGNNPLAQTEPCPNLGDPISYQPERFY